VCVAVTDMYVYVCVRAEVFEEPRLTDEIEHLSCLLRFQYETNLSVLFIPMELLLRTYQVGIHHTSYIIHHTSYVIHHTLHHTSHHASYIITSSVLCCCTHTHSHHTHITRSHSLSLSLRCSHTLIRTQTHTHLTYT